MSTELKCPRCGATEAANGTAFTMIGLQRHIMRAHGVTGTTAPGDGRRRGSPHPVLIDEPRSPANHIDDIVQVIPYDRAKGTYLILVRNGASVDHYLGSK